MHHMKRSHAGGEKAHGATHAHPGHGPYMKLGVMAVLSFVAMFILMYAMVDRFDNVFANINQTYMAALMAAPMVLIEIVVMTGMYPNRRANIGIAAAATVIGIGCWFAIRTQSGVGDQQFIKSMIPHHAGAVLMCEKNALRDPDLKSLCADIVTSQNAEIARMRALIRE